MPNVDHEETARRHITMTRRQHPHIIGVSCHFVEDFYILKGTALTSQTMNNMQHHMDNDKLDVLECAARTPQLETPISLHVKTSIYLQRSLVFRKGWSIVA